MPIFMKNGQNGKPELSLEAFFEIPIYGIFLCISRYFAKCTPTLRCHKNPTVESWELVEPILEAGNVGLQHISKRRKIIFLSNCRAKNSIFSWNWHFLAIKRVKNSQKSRISKKWLLFSLCTIKLQLHAHFYEKWTKW